MSKTCAKDLDMRCTTETFAAKRLALMGTSPSEIRVHAYQPSNWERPLT